jgi:methylenetetrahydrofolate dehydrogenase (NADP+)/methenyltetrahydrofolate cyclohydrolase
VGLDIRHAIESLDPLKDVDGIHPFNAGLISRGSIGFAPSCAEAAIEILHRTDTPVAGRPTVVLGRSPVVGRPVEQLLLREDATVTVCHRRTRDLEQQIRRAEIVIAAAGAPGLVTGDAIMPGAVVIDCGISVTAAGDVIGDVDLPSVAPLASLVTPVPGGVGPVTNAVLMHHLARAIRAQHDGGFPDAREMAS